MAQRALAELGDIDGLTVTGPNPNRASRRTSAPRASPSTPSAPPPPRYALGDKVATRAAYGAALVALGARNHRVVAMDGEVSNSTGTAEFAHHYPDRYFEMFIAEQQLVASAVGFSVRQYIPFASTFAAFLTRAHDFIRMAAISQANICLVGSHAGVEIGADGPSQMALEDLAMMRSIHGATVLYPCDATSAAALVDLMADAARHPLPRTTRGAYPVLYEPTATFAIGGSHTLRSSNDDQVTLIGAGVTVHQCLAAAESLRRDGIAARVTRHVLHQSRSILMRWSRRCALPVDGWSSPRTTTPREDSVRRCSKPSSGRSPPTSAGAPRRSYHARLGLHPTELLAAAAIDAASIDSAARRPAGRQRHPIRPPGCVYPHGATRIREAHVNRVFMCSSAICPRSGTVAIETRHYSHCGDPVPFHRTTHPGGIRAVRLDRRRRCRRHRRSGSHRHRHRVAAGDHRAAVPYGRPRSPWRDCA